MAIGACRMGTVVAILAAFGLAVGFAPADVAHGREKDCGWSGNAIPLMERADRRVRSAAVTERIKVKLGDDAMVTSYSRVEVDLRAAPGATTRATSAATLTRNDVTYNVEVVTSSGERTISAQVRFDSLCYRTTVVLDAPWVGSTGTDKPLRVNANKALRLAQEYRKGHQADYPLDQPLVSMNLMQATTAPPDFGRLRWYVNYDDGQGGLQILTVYMDGTVKPR